MQISEGVIRLSLRIRRITPSSICIILHIIRKPNSIIALLFIQNISRALKIYNFFLMGFCRVHGKIARYLKTMNKKQDKNDQQSFIQGSDKFAVRSKIRMNFLCTKPTPYNLASFGRNSISSTNRKIAQLCV